MEYSSSEQGVIWLLCREVFLGNYHFNFLDSGEAVGELFLLNLLSKIRTEMGEKDFTYF